jgi:hypothetical protein
MLEQLISKEVAIDSLNESQISSLQEEILTLDADGQKDAIKKVLSFYNISDDNAPCNSIIKTFIENEQIKTVLVEMKKNLEK